MAEDTRSGLVIVLGGINMDLVAITPRFPAAGETVVGDRFLTYPGGKGANQAVASAMMGAETLMVGRVGDDMFGPQLLAALRSKGVDVSGVAVSPGVSSGIAVIDIDASAQNRIIQILGANDTCGQEEAEAIAAAMGRASTLMLQLETPLDLSLRVAQEARSLGKTVILDPGPVRPIPQEFYACCNVITPNETEAQALVGFSGNGPGIGRQGRPGIAGPGSGVGGGDVGRPGRGLRYRPDERVRAAVSGDRRGFGRRG